MLRAIIDTNVWVSALLNRAGAPARVRSALATGHFTLLVSAPLLDELGEVLMRPRLARKYGITAADVTELLRLLSSRAEAVPVVGDLRLCRDPDDDVVIETAIRGGADMLVSRDDDLRDAPEVAEALAVVGIEVVSVRQFLLLLDDAAR